MCTTLAQTETKHLQMDGTPLHSEMMVFINDAPRDAQAQTVVDTHNHVHDTIDDMRWNF